MCLSPAATLVFQFISDCSLQTDLAVLILAVMRKTMTAKLIETLPLPKGKRLEVRDIYLPGLVLRVSKTGAKVWYATPRVDGRPKRIKIGAYANWASKYRWAAKETVTTTPPSKPS
jgi:hypothetical protein